MASVHVAVVLSGPQMELSVRCTVTLSLYRRCQPYRRRDRRGEAETCGIELAYPPVPPPPPIDAHDARGVRAAGHQAQALEADIHGICIAATATAAADLEAAEPGMPPVALPPLPPPPPIDCARMPTAPEPPVAIVTGCGRSGNLRSNRCWDSHW